MDLIVKFSELFKKPCNMKRTRYETALGAMDVFQIFKNEDESYGALIQFKTTQFPSCCGIGIIHGFQGYTSVSIGTPELLAVVKKIELFTLKERLFTKAMCTERLDRSLNTSAIIAAGYSKLEQFRNSNSGNIVVTYSRDITGLDGDTCRYTSMPNK